MKKISSLKVHLLGVIFDRMLTFKAHAKKLKEDLQHYFNYAPWDP